MRSSWPAAVARLASIRMKANTQGGGPVVDPGVHSASLDDDIAGFQMGHLTAVELEVALARQQQSIIDGLGCGA